MMQMTPLPTKSSVEKGTWAAQAAPLPGWLSFRRHKGPSKLQVASQSGPAEHCPAAGEIQGF